MNTTTDRATVGCRATADALTRLMLDSRTTTLPKAMNGHAVAPSDPRAAQIRKDITQGRADPIRLLLAVLACDVRDGVPFAEVVAPLRGMLAFLEVEAVSGAIRAAGRPIPTLVRAETRAQYHEDDAEHTVLERPECPDTLVHAALAADKHIAALAALRDGCNQEAAALRSRMRVTR